MTKEHFHIRPSDSGRGWSVDHYNGRGTWIRISHRDGSMTKAEEHFHIRPSDSGRGWSVDHYDERGAWVATDHGNGSMTKAYAQKKASPHRRLSVRGCGI